MSFNAETLAKAAATRRRNREQAKLKSQQAATGTATTSLSADDIAIPRVPAPKIEFLTEHSDTEVFDYRTAPLPLAIEHLASLKRQYDLAASIILTRQSRLPQTYVCWTTINRAIAPKNALSQCRGSVIDGKWAFRDDGARDDKGNLKPAVCCSMICYQFYQSERSKTISALSRH